MNIYKVLAYRTVFEVVNKSPEIIVTPPVNSKKDAELFARTQVPDPFIMQVQLFNRA